MTVVPPNSPVWIVYHYRNGIEISRHYRYEYKHIAAAYAASIYGLNPDAVGTLLACGRVMFTSTDYLILTSSERDGRTDPLYRDKAPIGFTTLADAVSYWNRKLSDDYPAIPPLTAEQCIELRLFGLVPYATLRFYGHVAEIISYPCPSKGHGATIMVRVPDDPTTMVEAAINRTAIDRVTEEK